MSDTFKIGQLNLNYCRATYNKSYENERSIEIPLGEYFLKKFNNDVAEVGAVMPYYGWDSHIIVDLTDTHPKSYKKNALECNYDGFNVLSLSTVEHMMKREYNNGSDEDSINFIKIVVKQAENYLITFPCCYNEFLDAYIKESDIPRVLIKRINQGNEWVQDFDLKNMNYLFGHKDGRSPDGVFNNSNCNVIVTNLPEILNHSIISEIMHPY